MDFHRSAYVALPNRYVEILYIVIYRYTTVYEYGWSEFTSCYLRAINLRFWGVYESVVIIDSSRDIINPVRYVLMS